MSCITALHGIRQCLFPSCSHCWGEPFCWHKLFVHSFRFPKTDFASPSRRRGLGKGTAFESLSPEVLSKSFCRSLCSQSTFGAAIIAILTNRTKLIDLREHFASR